MPTPLPSELAQQREDFEQLTLKIEAEARRDPAAYNRKLAFLAALGYGYILLVLVVALFLTFGLPYFAYELGILNFGIIKIGLFLALFDFALISSLFVRIPAPEGRNLTRSEVPQLFEAVDDIAARLKSPRPHHILLTEDLNAAVSQVPRFGILGGQRNYLIVGIQLLYALPPEEFRSVLAHEFGHLSGNHSRFGGYIYRVRRSWSNIMERVSQSHNWVFSRFFNWYAPHFAAYSFVLARQQEYVADRCATELSGPEVAAAALTRIAVVSSFLGEKYWPSVAESSRVEPEPPLGKFSQMQAALEDLTKVSLTQGWLTEALSRVADIDDTHPSLQQRLDAMSQKSKLTPRGPLTAADFYLGDQRDELTQEMELIWQKEIAPGWAANHHLLSTAAERLDAVEKKALAGELTREDEWDFADATEDAGHEDRALELMQAFAVKYPDDARAQYSIGRILLKRADESGLTAMENAVSLSGLAISQAAPLVVSYLLQRARTEEAQVWRDRHKKFEDQLVCAQVERSQLAPYDIMLPHGLDEKEVSAMLQGATDHPELDSIYLARKQLDYFPEQPLFLIGIYVPKKKVSVSDDAKRRENVVVAVANKITFERSHSFINVDTETDNNFLRSFERVPGSLIYKRG